MLASAFAVRLGVIAVNGVVIARDDIAREAQNHPAATPFASWREAARALVIRELLLQEARRLNLKADPQLDDDGRRESEDEALIRTLIETQITLQDADEAACRRYYDRNGARFRSADLFEAAHILLPAAPGDVQARTAAKEIAAHLIAELVAAPELFEELAARHSACPSAKQGGNLGQIGPGQTVPEFEAALAAMAAGSISRLPVATRYGLHIIRLDRRISGRDLPYELVADRIAAYLAERSHNDSMFSYMRWLAAHATITGIDLETGKVDPAAVVPPPANARHGVMRRFANGASAEDWTSLIGALQKAEDPAAACFDRMSEWQPPTAATATVHDSPRTLFTFGKSSGRDVPPSAA